MLEKFFDTLTSFVYRVMRSRGLTDSLTTLEQRRISVVLSINLFLLVLFPLYIIACYLIGLYSISTVDSIFFLVIITNYLTFRRAKDVSRVAIITILSVFFDLVFAYAAAGGGLSSNGAWLITLPLMSLLLVGLNLTFILTCMIPVAVYFVNNFIELAVFPEDLQYNLMMLNSGAMSLTVFLIIGLYNHSKNEFIRDITRKTSELEVLNDNRKYLLSVLFHDLSNSLMIVKNASSEKLIHDRDCDKLLRNMAKVSRASNSMEEVLNHVKVFQEQEKVLPSLELESVRVVDCLEEAQFLFRDKLEKKGLKLILDVEDTEMKVLAHRVSLCHSILNNLISNAIKFSKENDEIRIKCYRSGIHVVIEVIDRGIGIPKSFQEALFDVDEFTTRPGTRGEKGTGYGLPLVKRYIDIFGGEISIESAESGDKQGSTFRVSLLSRPE